MNIPSKLLERVDFRHYTVLELAHILKELNKTQETNYKLHLITNFAMIEADFVEKTDDDVEDDNESFLELAAKKAIEFRNETIIEAEQKFSNPLLLNAAGHIVLRNVTIFPFGGGSRYVLESMLLFTEQIAGLTIGLPHE